MDKSEASERFKRIVERATQKVQRHASYDRARYLIESELSTHARIYGDAANRAALEAEWEIAKEELNRR